MKQPTPLPAVAAAFASRAVSDPARVRFRTAALIAVFIVTLDVSIVNVAIPTLAGKLHASLSSLQWVLDAYIVAFAALLLATGRLAEMLGAVRLLRAGVFLFTFASIACAVVSSADGLIAARVVQGVGASLVLPSSLAIVTGLSPRESLGRALAAFSAIIGAATALGPSAGAVLLQNFSWRAIFLINVPIGVAAIAFSLGQSKAIPRGGGGRVDLLGALLSAGGMFGVTYGLIDAGRNGWSALATLVPLVAGLLLLFAFAISQLTGRDGSLLDRSLFSRRDVPFGSIATMLMFTATMGATFLAPLVLLGVYGWSLLRMAGILSLTSLAILVAAPLSGRFVERLGVRVVASVGLLFEAGALFGFSTFGTHPAYGAVLGVGISLGIGMGVALPPLTLSVMGAVADRLVNRASALFSTFRQMGLALGIALAGSLAQTRITGSVAHLPSAMSEGIKGGSITELLARLAEGRGAGGQVADGTRHRLLANAIWSGFSDTFLVVALIPVLAAILVMLFVGRKA